MPPPKLFGELAVDLDAARASDDPTLLVAAALSAAADADALMARARSLATSARDRQLIAIAGAHLRGERDIVDALARDHLVDHPDSVLAAWIADVSHHKEQP